jgi:Carboxypeptidase regulatory-like domain/TonB-dependent Receptor Plug Domain
MKKLGRSTIAIFMLLLGFAVVSGQVQGQTQTTGNIAGTVTDPTGGVVPGATVALKDVSQGNTHTTTTNAAGAYHFFLLTPGPYVVTVTATGFQSANRPLTVALGAVATGDIQLTLGAASETVTVTEQSPLLQTQNGDAETTLSEQVVQQIPNSGNDMSFTAELAPGVVANTSGGGLGNFSSFGLGADANLFTINGMDDNDPFLNLNNTGATNLMLGNNEVQEMSVVQNGYSAAYGGLAGAQINVITASGTNQWHGRATYYWNGRVLNANNYFNNAAGVDRSFVNANQWGADIGGPIIKNHLFGYFNTEGLYLVVPTSTQAFIPTAGVASATEANIASIYGPASPQEAFYTKMFNLYAGAPGYAGALPVAGGGCDSSVATVNTHLPSGTMPFGGGPGEQPCQLLLQSNIGNLTHDWIVAGRIDWNATNNDRVYTRIKKEHGLQASFTDAINPLFNFGSDQPEFEGQFQWSHTFGATAVNQFNFSAQWYAAAFANSDQAATLAAFPTTLIFGSGAFVNSNSGTSLGGIDYDFPQGRNVTQYQLSDDYSKTIGNHSVKVGVKFHRNDVSDLDNGINNTGQLTPATFDAFFMGGYDPTTLSAGTNPNISTLTQSFASVSEFPVAAYGLAGYIEDDWKIRPNLTLNFGFRVEHQSNAICVNDCFAAPVVEFSSLDHDPTIPYNAAIVTGRRQALYSLTAANVEPRFGFAWSPGKLRNTVIRGGAGIFYDAFPDVVVDNFAQNPPLYNQFTVGTATNPGQITPGVPGSLFTAAAASNSAFVGGFNTGATLADLQTLVPGFTPPSLTSAQSHNKTAQVQKWSLEIQHSFGANASLTVGYVGNHAQNLSYFNNGLNAYDPSGTFVGLPTSPTDQRFGEVTQVNTTATSNYNGLYTSFQRRFGASQFTVNYTYSRALDYSSNSGNPNVTFSNSEFGASNTSISYPEDPFHPFRYNYGPADYNATHYFSANYIWQLPIRRALFGHGPSRLVDGWQVSGTVFARSGMPYTLIDGASSAALGGTNYGVGEDLFGLELARGGQGFNCKLNGGAPNQNICLNPADFSQNVNGEGIPLGFGNVSRNSLTGPVYFNSDFAIMKFTSLPKFETAKVGLGVQFFNVFNHPNFQQPVGDVSSTLFGQVISTVSPATSIFGSGLGADSSPRLIQLKAQFVF